MTNTPTIATQSKQFPVKVICWVLMVFLCVSTLSTTQSHATAQSTPKNPFEAYHKPYLDHIVGTPWLRHFIAGDLPLGAFQHFLGQDVLYLEDYQRASHMIALRFPAHDPRRDFFEHYAKGVEEERLWELQQLRAAHYAVPQHKVAANAGYTHFLLDKAKNGTLPEAVAALIPCETLWEALGRYIQHHVTDVAHHPYKQWVVMYSDPSFQQVAQAILHVEEGLLAQQPQLKAQAITAYKIAANFEVGFFQGALEERSGE